MLFDVNFFLLSSGFSVLWVFGAEVTVIFFVIKYCYKLNGDSLAEHGL